MTPAVHVGVCVCVRSLLHQCIRACTEEVSALPRSNGLISWCSSWPGRAQLRHREGAVTILPPPAPHLGTLLLCNLHGSHGPRRVPTTQSGFRMPPTSLQTGIGRGNRGLEFSTVCVLLSASFPSGQLPSAGLSSLRTAETRGIGVSLEIVQLRPLLPMGKLRKGL